MLSRVGVLLERHFEEVLACTGLVVVVVCVFLQVIMRYVFHSALQWTEEVAAIAMVWAVYMGAALGVRERFHIRILAGVMLLPRPAARAVVIFSDIVWLAFMVLMVGFAWNYLGVLWEHTSRTPRLGINEFYPQSIVFIGYALMIVRLFQIYWLWTRAGCIGIPGMRPEYEQTQLEVER